MCSYSNFRKILFLNRDMQIWLRKLPSHASAEAGAAGAQFGVDVSIVAKIRAPVNVSVWLVVQSRVHCQCHLSVCLVVNP